MPQIIESDSDIFESGCEALVSPVDATTGVQGKGLALAFAQRYTRQTTWYRAYARSGVAEPGQIYHVLPKNDADRLSAARWVLGRHREGGEPLVLFATTKNHWKLSSTLTWVVGCCSGLVDVVTDLGIRSIAIPALGAGLGGLPWTDVRPLILAAAERMRCERVVVFGPKESIRR